ncbi:MAG: hypothetical protein R2880_07890 [Deinococcales bacterium]
MGLEHPPSQTYTLNLSPKLYLPSLAERFDCDAEIALDFGFSEHRQELMRSAIFYGPEESIPQGECYLFREVYGAAARKLVADIFKVFVDADFWHGIPTDYSGMFLVQSSDDPSHIAFSFLNEAIVLGPYAGVVGFDLSEAQGLKMYVWAYHRFY